MPNQVKIKNVLKGQQIFLKGISCIKASQNIIEVNEGIDCLTCFVQEDTTANNRIIDPETSIFVFDDGGRRIGGECLVEIE